MNIYANINEIEEKCGNELFTRKAIFEKLETSLYLTFPRKYLLIRTRI